MWVAWLQWIAAYLMQDLVNVTLIVKAVSIKVWQYTESWKEEVSVYEQLLDTVSFPVFPQAKVDSILMVCSPKLDFHRLASCHFQAIWRELERKHRGYCFHWWCICIVPLQQFVLSWEGLRLGGMSTGCVHLASWEQYKSKMIDRLHAHPSLTVW